jgi:hypothetical protein
MAFIPHAIGTIDVDYTPNADRQIVAPSRQPADHAPAGERFVDAVRPSSHRRVHQACRGFHKSGAITGLVDSGARVGIMETAK